MLCELYQYRFRGLNVKAGYAHPIILYNHCFSFRVRQNVQFQRDLRTENNCRRPQILVLWYTRMCEKENTLLRALLMGSVEGNITSWQIQEQPNQNVYIDRF